MWRHRDDQNVETARTGVDTALGPNPQDAVVEDLNLAASTTANRVLAFCASSRAGLWRWPPDEMPQAVAFTGERGSVAPTVGTFSAIGAWTVFANGDVVARCTVSGGTSGLYRFPPGERPQRILGTGQTVRVPTSPGEADVTRIDVARVPGSLGSTGPSSHAPGYDSWAGRNSLILLRAPLCDGVGGTLNALTLLDSSDQDPVLRDGLE